MQCRSVEKIKEYSVSRGGVFIKILVAVGLMALVGVLLFPIFAVPSSGHGRSCLSNLKQLAVGVAIYQSDADDNVPPYFTFDGPEKSKQFMSVIMEYAKNEQIFLCPQDTTASQDHQEGLAGKMSYVHCLSLRGRIPDFNKGKRMLKVTDSMPNLATTPLLRDPIRGFGTSDNKQGPTSTPAFLSPHGATFMISYLDTHVNAKKNIDEFTDL